MRKLILLLFLFINIPFVFADNETLIIAKTISAEACGEGYRGMYAVANVIKNRAIKYSISPYKVVIAKNQFYGYTATNREALFYQCQKEALYIAENLMFLPDITEGALYFRRENEKLQAWHNIKTVTIKNHIFYK